MRDIGGAKVETKSAGTVSLGPDVVDDDIVPGTTVEGRSTLCCGGKVKVVLILEKGVEGGGRMDVGVGPA